MLVGTLAILPPLLGAVAALPPLVEHLFPPVVPTNSDEPRGLIKEIEDAGSSWTLREQAARELATLDRHDVVPLVVGSIRAALLSSRRNARPWSGEEQTGGTSDLSEAGVQERLRLLTVTLVGLTEARSTREARPIGDEAATRAVVGDVLADFSTFIADYDPSPGSPYGKRQVILYTDLVAGLMERLSRLDRPRWTSAKVTFESHKAQLCNLARILFDDESALARFGITKQTCEATKPQTFQGAER